MKTTGVLGVQMQEEKVDSKASMGHRWKGPQQPGAESFLGKRKLRSEAASLLEPMIWSVSETH